jgi:hypothetical protein
MAVAFTDGAFALASHGRHIAAAVLDGVLGGAIFVACGAAGFDAGLRVVDADQPAAASAATDDDLWPASA